MDEADLARLPFPAGTPLHVRSSSLAPGTYDDVGDWPKVVVGGDVWDELPK